VLVALPSIHRVCSRAECKPIDGLAKGKVRIAIMRTEFDKASRPEDITNPESERSVLDPCGLADIVRAPE